MPPEMHSYNLRERQKKMLSIGPYPLLRRYFPGSEEVTHAGDQNLVATTVYSQDSFTFSEFPGKGGGKCRRKCIAIIYESVKERCSRLTPIPCFAGTSPGSEEVTHAGNQNLVATTVYSQDSFTFSEFPGKGGGECHRKCVAITYESVKKRCSRLAPIPCFAGTSPGSEKVTHAGNQHLVATTVYSQDSFTFSDSEEVTHTKGSASSSNHCVFPG